MKIILSIFLTLLSISAICQNKEQIRIKTFTTDGDKISEMVSSVTSDYFEISLMSINKGAAFIGENDIERPKMGVPFHKISFDIVDKSGEIIKFKESTEFLNYMSSHGYSMVDQKKERFHTDYTFKKK